MPVERVQQSLSEVPQLDRIVDARTDHLLGGVVEGDRRHGVLMQIDELVDGLLRPQIVDQNCPVVRARDHEHGPSPRGMARVHDLRVIFVLAHALAALHVPNAAGFVGRTGEQVAERKRVSGIKENRQNPLAVRREERVHDGARVSAERREILALAVHVPQD